MRLYGAPSTVTVMAAIERSGRITVEVAYALADRQFLRPVTLPVGATVETAIRASGLLAEFPALTLVNQPVGVFSRPCALTDPVMDGDRVELYRPLSADPKQVRRRLAAEDKAMGQG